MINRLIIIGLTVIIVLMLSGISTTILAKDSSLNSIPTLSTPPTGQYIAFNYNLKNTVVLPAPATYPVTTIQNTPCPSEKTIGDFISGGHDITTKNQDKEYEQNTAMALSDVLQTKSPDYNTTMYFWCGIYSPSEAGSRGNNDNSNPNILH